MTTHLQGIGAVPLRQRLFLLVAAGVVPLGLFSAVIFYTLLSQQRVRVQTVGSELARALASAVDAELQKSIAVLSSAATASTLERGDLQAFHEGAQSIVATQPQWVAVTLADRNGRLVLDTRRPYGATPPFSIDTPSFARVVRAGVPVVGNLARPDPGGSFVFPVRVPVFRATKLQYVLSALVRPDDILDVITRQHAPGDWVISIFDANGRRVARSRAHAETLGGPAAPSLQALMASPAAEGIGPTVDLEGNPIYTAYSRLPSIGWSAAPGIPVALVDGAAFRFVGIYGSALFLSLVIGTGVAFAVARAINRPMHELRVAALALGRRQPLQAPGTSIREIRDVGVAMAAAAEELAKADAEREQLLGNERWARQTAEAAVRARDEFLAVLSHELRTPLNAVYGWARMLRSGQVVGDDAAHALEVIVRNADAQVQLIDDLLDIARIVSGKMRLDVRQVDLSGVVEAALDAVRPAADAKAIRLERVLDPGAAPVTVDPARLQQVLWNLLMNAVKFTPRSGRVEVRLQRMESQIEIIVSDTGEGIAPEVLPFVFDRFRQSDSSRTRAHGGLGLGLALVKHLVELHGGAVVARSSGEGKGATFIVTLPLASGAGSLESGRPVESGGAFVDVVRALASLEGLRVLIVDDEPHAVALEEAILRRAGAQVRTSLTVAEALRVVTEWHPDVLVSDIEMPGEDGYSLIRKVRALSSEDGGRTPAVALTAYGRTEDRARTLAAGYSMHVPKPVDPGELTTIITSLAARPSSSGAP